MKSKAKAYVRSANFWIARALPLSLSALVVPSTIARASPELDRKYALQTVGALKSADNVDGLFGDYVAQALRDYFQSQPRFVLQDVSRAQTLIDKSKLGYDKLIDDKQILERVARASRSETLLRTKIFKEGPRYRVTLDWLLAPHMDLIANEVFFIDEPRAGATLVAEDLKRQIQAGADRLVRKVPFYAQINGRDGQLVTINAGENLSLRKGDTLWVGSIDEVKQHPLLRVVAEWKMARTGALEVEHVDGGIAFCRITEENPNRPIARGQKITQVIPASTPSKTHTDSTEDTGPTFDRTDAPKLGWISATPGIGLFSRDFSASTGNTGKSGGGFLIGARTDGVIWLDRQWFTEASIGYSYFPYSQTNSADGSDTGVSSSGTLLQYKLALAYSYLSGEDLFGPKSWFKVGYYSHRFALPNLTTENLNPVTWSGLMIGVGGDLPLRQGWGAQLSLEFGLLNSAKETGASAPKAQTASMVNFYIGSTYALRPRLIFRMGFEFEGQGATYSGGASLSHQSFNLMPSLTVPF